MMQSDEHVNESAIRTALHEQDYHRAYTIAEGYMDILKTDRDKLAERVKAVEGGALHDQFVAQQQEIERLTQRLAEMEEAFNNLLEQYQAMQRTAMKLFDRVNSFDMNGFSEAEREAILQEISPVGTINSEDIDKAKQAREGKK